MFTVIHLLQQIIILMCFHSVKIKKLSRFLSVRFVTECTIGLEVYDGIFNLSVAKNLGFSAFIAVTSLNISLVSLDMFHVHILIYCLIKSSTLNVLPMYLLVHYHFDHDSVPTSFNNNEVCLSI